MIKRLPKRPRWRGVFDARNRLVGFIEQHEDGTWRAIAGEAVGRFATEAAAEDFVRTITGSAKNKDGSA